MLLRMVRSLPKVQWLILGCCLLMAAGSAYGQATSVTSQGFNATEGGGGSITWGWSTGNLGNSWAEGEWVPYQLTISNVQTDYPGLVGLPDIVMEYDFTAQNDARFVDLVRSIQVGTAPLTNAQGWPRDDGSAYPLSNSDRTLLEQAQNDFGNTPPLENTWPGFTQLNLPEAQINRAAPPTYGLGTPDDQFRYFYITRQNLIDAGVDPNANTIVIYYQLHESRSFIWMNSLQEYYDQSPTDEWGGYLYSTGSFPSDVREAAGYVPGSSGQIRVSFGGGDKTVPIPIPERLPGAVYGLKWFDVNGNRVQDPGELPLDGWRIFVKGTLEGINFADTTVTAGGGLYSFPNLTSGTTWFVYEDAQRFSPATTGWTQTYPILASTMGVASGWTVNPVDPTHGAIGWQVPLTLSDTGQANLNFGNRQCTIEITCPVDVIRECYESTDTLYTGTPTVDANCGLASLIYSDSTAPGTCPQEYTIYRRWIATDSTGLADTCVQMITVQDNNNPWITGVGAADTVECPATPSFSTPSAFDSCDTDVDLTYVDSTFPGACPQEYSVKRTWTATDDCGNTATASQTIWVEDNTAPVFAGVGAADTIECPLEPSFSSPSASDLCDADVTITYVDTTYPGACDQEYSVKRTWKAVDDCGNTTYASQTIWVEDNTAPEITGVGTGGTIECPNTPVFSTPAADDACDPSPSLTYVDSTFPGTCPQEYSVQRTWTATDDCGNSSTASEIIYVEDNTAPEFSGVGSGGTIECPATPVFSNPTADDLCDEDVTITYVDTTTPGSCPAEYSVKRTWKAVDDCGNETYASETIYVEDNTVPTISGVGADFSVECPDPYTFSDPTASDLCDEDVDLTYEDFTSEGFCPYTITRIWTAVDDCGNMVKDTQVVTVTDETAPVISGVGAADTIECPAEPVFSEPTADDACDPNPVLRYIDSTFPGGCPAEYSVKRTWIATDGCGNADTVSQTIWVEDNTPPEFAGVGGPETIECPAEPSFSDPTASDLCDADVTITYVDTTYPGDCPQEYSVKRTWKATDDCGNFVYASQIITVEDNTAPEFSGVGSGGTIECPNTPVFSNPSASDLCDLDVTVTYVDTTTPGSCPQEYSVKRTWKAVDDCGNTTYASETIYVEDNAPPVISGVGADTTIECPDQPTFSNPIASDLCDEDVSLTYEDFNGGTCPLSVTRIWTAADDCGNFVKDTQVVYIDDTTPPSITGVGANDTIQCPNEPVFSEPAATDACDPEATLTYVDSTFEGSCPQEYYVKRTWIATDACDNSASASQTIWVVDDTPPAFSGVGPADTVECPAEPVFSEPTASDLCDPEATVTFVDSTFPGSCPNEYSVRRTWKAIDDCGNSVYASQTIWVEDNTAPVLSGCPTDTTVLCSEDLPTPASVTALDACEGAIEPVFSADTTAGDCYAEYTLVRKWIATDACGNKDSCMQTIWVVDSMAPVLTCAADDTIGCEDDLAFTPPTLEDNCNDSIEVVILSTDTTSGPGLGEFTYTRTWTAYDACSELADTCSQTIIREACGGMPCTYTQGGWGSGCPESQQDRMESTQPGCIRDHYFDEVFPNGVIIGDPAGPGAGPANWYAAKWDSAAAVNAFLPSGGKPSTLRSDLTNPSYTTAGVLAGQILALKLNVGFSCAGIFYDLGLQDELNCFGEWIIPDTCGSKFAGLTVNEFLVIADSVVGGKTAALTAFGASISDVNYTATCLNELYNNCYVEPVASVVPEENLPKSFALEQNYPNPFNPTTTISYSLPTASNVKIEIYNVLGQKVVTLVDGYRGAGTYTAEWNAGSNASGIYLYRMTAGNYVTTKKMLMLK